MYLERIGDARRPAIVEVGDDISTTSEPMDDAVRPVRRLNKMTNKLDLTLRLEQIGLMT